MTQTREGLIKAIRTKFECWFRESGVDFWHESGAPEELAGLALAAIEEHAAVVPREPTQEMRHAGGSARVYPSCYMGGPPPAAQRDAQRIYEAMCAVSPFAPEKEARDE